MRRRPMSLEIKEIQTKSALTNHPRFITESRSEKSNNTKCWQGHRTKGVHRHLLTGVEFFTITLKSSLAKLSQIENDMNRPRSSTSRTMPWRKLGTRVRDMQRPECSLLCNLEYLYWLQMRSHPDAHLQENAEANWCTHTIKCSQQPE